MNEYWKNYRDYLLQVMPNAKLVSGGKEINCRCVNCGDSVKSNNGHMYISIPQDNKTPSVYNCFKCGNSGVVTHTTLLSWGVYDKHVALDLMMLNSKVSKTSAGRKYFGTNIYKLAHSHTTIDDKSEYKRQYICNRVGVDLSYENLRNLKICLNLNDILKENHIVKLSRYENIINELDREFVGFISVDNAYLNMRRTCDEGIVYKSIDKRYVNYQLFDKTDTTQRFYTIPSQIDLNSPYRIPLHIAEGPFDILSIYLNLRECAAGIYAAVSGNNYINTINYFLISMQLPYLEIHLYPDNDKYGNKNYINKIVSNIPDPNIPIYLHKNIFEGEKDWGVPGNRIVESSMRIK